MEFALIAFIPLGMLAGAVWIWIDASERTDYGCVWAALALLFPLIVIPLYIFMRFYATRPVSRRALAEHERERARFTDSRFPSDIDRTGYIRQAASGPGTLFNPAGGGPAGGYKHFTDHRAEALIEQARYEEALDYLLDLYSVAEANGDNRALDTYRHYFSLLPAGSRQFEAWRRRGRPQQDAPPHRGGRDRDVPF